MINGSCKDFSMFLVMQIVSSDTKCNSTGLQWNRDMFIVPNTQTSITDDTRSYLTLPSGLRIKNSSIPKAGLGVWTERDFPKGTRFGPYDGIVTNHTKNWKYVWDIYNPGFKIKHFVDAEYKNSSNWVRFVNSARTVDEENLYAFQLDDNIYYVTYDCVKSGTELLVWYGDAYGKEIGLQRSPQDYQRRFEIDNVKYIVENTINDNVSRLYKHCYKFYDNSPFIKPHGRFWSYDKYCLYDGSYLVCKYKRCQKNPCTSKTDCKDCEGYCLHLGKYIRNGENFDHSDKVNTCICHKDGQFGCTTEYQSLEKLCGD